MKCPETAAGIGPVLKSPVGPPRLGAPFVMRSYPCPPVSLWIGWRGLCT
jgi:hypothetical protein